MAGSDGGIGWGDLAEKTDLEKLIAQYDIGDRAESSDISFTFPEKTETSVSSETKPFLLARDAETGQFVSSVTAAPVAPTYKHSNLLLGRAKEVGLTDDVIAETPTEDLRDYINSREAHRREQDFRTAMDKGKVQTPQVGLPESSIPNSNPDDPAFDRTLYDEGLLNYFEKKIASLEARLNEVHGYQREQIRESLQQKYDREFEALGKEFEPFLGKGRGKDLDNDSTELLLRRKVIEDAYKLSGNNPDPERVASKLKEAAMKRFRKVPEIVEKKQKPVGGPPDDLLKEVEDWNNAGLQIPTNRSGGRELPPVGRERAVMEVANAMRENGQIDTHHVTLNDFPQ